MERLNLSLYKKWFDEILTGTKKIEYREIKPYYNKIFVKEYSEVKFVNGYGNERPFMIVEILKVFKSKEYYEIHLGNIIEKGNL